MHQQISGYANRSVDALWGYLEEKSVVSLSERLSRIPKGPVVTTPAENILALWGCFSDAYCLQEVCC